jgi:hypothetical protein
VRFELFAELGLERCQTGRAGLGQRFAGPQPLVEVGRGQVDLVAERLTVPIDDQRHHAQAEALLDGGPEVRSAIGDDADCRHQKSASLE